MVMQNVAKNVVTKRSTINQSINQSTILTDEGTLFLYVRILGETQMRH